MQLPYNKTKDVKTHLQQVNHCDVTVTSLAVTSLLGVVHALTLQCSFILQLSLLGRHYDVASRHFAAQQSCTAQSTASYGRIT